MDKIQTDNTDGPLIIFTILLYRGYSGIKFTNQSIKVDLCVVEKQQNQRIC